MIYGDAIRPAAGLFTAPAPGGPAPPAFGLRQTPGLPRAGVPTPPPPVPTPPAAGVPPAGLPRAGVPTPPPPVPTPPPPPVPQGTPTPPTPAPSSQPTTTAPVATGVDFPVDDVKCCDCNKVLTKDCAYPKDDDQEWGVGAKEMRCQECWRKHVTTDMVDVVENPDKREAHVKAQNKKKKKSEKPHQTHAVGVVRARTRPNARDCAVSTSTT